MDAAQFFLLRHEPLHALMTDRVVADLTDAHFRARPHGLNSIAWLLWHVARGEDIGVNRFAYDREQVLDEGGWLKRIGAGRRDLGTAMTAEEVAAFSATVDVGALRAYWQAVGQRTRETVLHEGTAGWHEVVDPARIRHAIREAGDYGPRVIADRTEAFYAGMTRGWAFAHLALTHSYGHIAEAGVTRGQLGFPGV
jgi:hypothetical protein